MLIEFSVSNFRSFREKQTFSLVAAPRLSKKENTFKPDVDGEDLPRLLRVAAIYGPNASGKSNLIKSLEVVRNIAIRSPNEEEQLHGVSAFRFDSQLTDQPSCFEFHFIKDRQRYVFELAVTSARIEMEKLTGFPKGKETLLYERRHTQDGEIYILGEKLEGGSALHEAWRKLTNSQTLFIAQAVANSNEELQQLRAPFNWLRRSVLVVSDDMRNWARVTQSMVQENGALFRQDLSLFLQDVDVPITAIEFEPNDERPKSLSIDDVSTIAAVSNTKKNHLANGKGKTTFTHKTALGEAKFDFKEESVGTQNLVGFWLPWSIVNDGTANIVDVLAVDELDSSLHPRIVANLVEKHLKLERPTQLIFTTHDTHLMDTKLLRRDQFWLTERDANGATQLRSIHDFEGRESEDVEKRYYEGRYRGLPFLRRR